jgi:hypothetical protein
MLQIFVIRLWIKICIQRLAAQFIYNCNCIWNDDDDDVKEIVGMRSLYLTQNVQFSVDFTNSEKTLLNNEINCKT